MRLLDDHLISLPIFHILTNPQRTASNRWSITDFDSVKKGSSHLALWSKKSYQSWQAPKEHCAGLDLCEVSDMHLMVDLCNRIDQGLPETYLHFTDVGEVKDQSALEIGHFGVRDIDRG